MATAGVVICTLLFQLALVFKSLYGYLHKVLLYFNVLISHLDINERTCDLLGVRSIPHKYGHENLFAVLLWKRTDVTQ